MQDVRDQPSPLGADWHALYRHPVDFGATDFLAAMNLVIRNPNFNSSVLMRADIYFERTADGTTNYFDAAHSGVPPEWKAHNIEDKSVKLPTIPSFSVSAYLVRRNIPRNPDRDPVVNQSCVTYKGPQDEVLIIYVPHLVSPDDCPYYLPRAAAVGLMYSPVMAECSVHIRIFPGDEDLRLQSTQNRLIRIGYHLLKTCVKHASGCATGYRKRVQHDQIVDRVKFQNRYLALKHKYAASLVASWVEQTDPTKHVFEDLGIAAFLIELWGSDPPAQFLDLGCGNGLLVHILISEGYNGDGIDARARKSWKIWPATTQQHLQAKLIMPELLRPQIPAKDTANVVFIGASNDTFLIGNHSDELTLWMPLFQCPFLVIPCCSHTLDGKRARFFDSTSGSQSKYAGLLAKVRSLSERAGWEPEVEMLRIPSTRNAALIGRRRQDTAVNIRAIVDAEGGESGWYDNVVKLAVTAPRDH